MALKLDKSKPYQIVYGPDREKYEQDGVAFDGAGVEVSYSTPVINRKKKGKAVKVQDSDIDENVESDIQE